MNRDEITRKTSELSTIAHTTEDSKVEYWYARELMTYMGLQPVNLIACFRLFSYDILESCVSGNGRGVRASTSRRYGSGAVRTACPSHLSA